MRRRLLYIHDGEMHYRIFINIDSALYSHMSTYLLEKNGDFQIDKVEDKLHFFEGIIFLLKTYLEKRGSQKTSMVSYLPIEDRSVSVNVFGVDLSLLQGDEFDGAILILLELRKALKISLINQIPIVGEYILRKADAY